MLKNVICAFAIFLAAISQCYAQTGAAKTKAAVQTDLNNCFPSQVTEAITPSIALGCFSTMLASWQQFPSVNAQTGTSYTFLSTDYGKLVTFNNGSSIAVSLSSASALNPWNVYVQNLGAGTATITPSGSAINGASSYAVGSGVGIWIVSDGINYQVFRPGAAASAITGLTGDVTAAGPGSVAATLATVNVNVGAFGSSTAIPSFTVNAKGLITAASTNAVVAPAGTLTGTTLASNVVASSLTSVGTIASGTWQGTLLAGTYGGTGVNNGARTITTGGNVTFSGAFATTLTVTATTNSILPAGTKTILGGDSVGQIRYSATVDFNAANTDTAITIALPTGVTKYLVGAVRIGNASASLTTATFGVFTAAAGGGVAIVTAASACTVSTASDATNNNSQTATVNNSTSESYTASTLYFRVATAQGSAATATVTIIIIPIG